MTHLYPGKPIRHHFALDFATAFLNHGSFGATPIPVLDYQSALRTRMERNPVRFIDRDAREMLRAAAERIGAFLGAHGNEVVFVENATTGVNAVVSSLHLGAEDEILTTSFVYGAVRNALRHHGGGARIVEAQLPFPIADPASILAAVEAAITPQTRLAVLDWISSEPGLILPIKKLISICQRRGIPVLVDGAHAPGHVEVDLHALGCEWFVGNLHKWLFAPKGCAVLYARADQQDLLPTTISWDYQDGFTAAFDYTGTRDPTAFLSSIAGLDFLEDVGWNVLQEYNRALAQRSADMLAAAWSTTRPAPREMTANLVTLRPPAPWDRGDPARLKDHLWNHGIEIPVIPFAGANWVRISAQVYNIDEDYARLADALSPG